MKPTRERALNAGFEKIDWLEEAFELKIGGIYSVYIFFDSKQVVLSESGTKDYHKSNLDTKVEFEEKAISDFVKSFTGQPLNFEKKEEWKIGNVLKYVCSDNTYYTGVVCKVRENGRIDFLCLDTNGDRIITGKVYEDFKFDAYNKIAETPEEYYRKKFESEKSNEPKEEVKEVEPQIGEVWEVTIGDSKEIISVINIDDSSIPYLVFKVNKIGSSYDGEWCSKRYITFNKKLADSYKEYIQQ